MNPEAVGPAEIVLLVGYVRVQELQLAAPHGLYYYQEAYPVKEDYLVLKCLHFFNSLIFNRP